MNVEFNTADVKALRTLLEGARRIMLTCHMSPDGDALGSTLAMRSLLRTMGKDARVITPDEPPHYLRVIPGAGKRVGETVEFGGLLGHAPIMKVSKFSCAQFIARKGRIPAPIHSFKN